MVPSLSSSHRTKVYNPKTFILHAALLHQGFPHCAISPTAASRRSLGRVSVPMWPFNLSVRLPIVALVGRYPANWLIGRESISQRIAPLISRPCGQEISCGISVLFKTLSPSERQVTHVLLTRPPLSNKTSIRKLPSSYSVRLACVRHAASVRPEPGSNSLKYCIESPLRAFQSYLRAFVALSVHLRVFAFFEKLCLLSFSYQSPDTQSHYGYFLNRSLFNFQGSASVPLIEERALHFITLSCVCQALFSSLFWDSLDIVSLSRCSVKIFFRLSRRLDYNTTPFPACQRFFSNFSNIFSFSFLTPAILSRNRGFMQNFIALF